MDPYQYGYYEYNNIKTTSKYEIMRLCDNPDQVIWHYHDDIFNSFDWTKEPEESIEILYKNRCEQLRSSYDYIVLMYSGGSDCNNILDTFARNNIHLDEICSHINYEGSGTVKNLLNNEILMRMGNHGAAEKAENYIKKYNMHTKFRLYDVTQNTLKIYNSFNLDFNYFINNAGVSYTQSKPKAGRIMETGIKKWMDMYTSGKKICFLWGNDKPKIQGINDIFHFEINDHIDQSFSIKSVLNNEMNAVDELFYRGPNEQSIKIMIKQGHILKRCFYNIAVRLFLIKKYNKPHTKEQIYQNELFSHYKYSVNGIEHKCRLGNDEIRRLIYPNWKLEDEILNKKQISNFLNDKDKWFWNSNAESKTVYLSGLQNFTNSIQPCWINSKSQFENKQYVEKIKFLSKYYRIQ